MGLIDFFSEHWIFAEFEKIIGVKYILPRKDGRNYVYKFENTFSTFIYIYIYIYIYLSIYLSIYIYN